MLGSHNGRRDSRTERAGRKGNGDCEGAVAGSSSAPSPFGETRQHDAGGAIELLHKILTELLADPDSTKPFELVLSHIAELSGTQAGAIFVSTESGRQLVLLASVGPDDRDRWMRAIAQCGLFKSLGGGKATETFCDSDDPGSTIVAQSFTQGTSGHGLLLLRVEGDDVLVSTSTLQSFGEYLAGVLYSARCARMKLRNAQSEERAAIARELHDSLAQSISYLKVKVSLLQDMLKQRGDGVKDVETALQELRGTLSTADLQLRELITTFRLTMRGRTFAQALEDSIEEFERRSSIAFDLDNRLAAGKLTVAEEMQLLLIFREALCNVVRHSHASYCWVSLRPTPDDGVFLGVDDNGVGIQHALRDSEQHHGLIIMQERSRGLGGTMRLEDREGGGTRLLVNIPCNKTTASNSLIEKASG